jgi:hypothetical protein
MDDTCSSHTISTHNKTTQLSIRLCTTRKNESERREEKEKQDSSDKRTSKLKTDLKRVYKEMQVVTNARI